MKVRDLENNILTWKLTGYVVQGIDLRSRSQLHIRARQLIKKLFPMCQILEEVPVKVRPDQNGFFDFYINSIKTVIEVHGVQHYKFSPLFHTSAQDFLKQQKRDNEKREWCELNNISYIELPHNESDDQWKSRIKPNI